MNELQRSNIQTVSEWLSGEIELRIARKWLLLAAMILSVLVIVAFD